MLRTYLDQEKPPVGWLRLLADEPLAPPMRLLHEHRPPTERLSRPMRSGGFMGGRDHNRNESVILAITVGPDQPHGSPQAPTVVTLTEPSAKEVVTMKAWAA